MNEGLKPRHNPLKSWKVDPNKIEFIGHDLRRPECILAERDGTLWSADARGGVMKIAPDGKQSLIAQSIDPHFDLGVNAADSLLTGTLPNGLAFDRSGKFLIANFGTDRLELMDRSGNSQVLLDNIDGEPLGKVNFVLRDSKDRIWITISTMVNPWSDAINANMADGKIIVLDENGARVVADGLGFVNEIRFDAQERWLYVAETTRKRVTRIKIEEDGTVAQREIFGPPDLGSGLIDGIAFDAFGNLWATMIFADRLIAITPGGELLELFSDGHEEATSEFETAFASGASVPFDTLMKCGGKTCPWMASITFGGPDLSRVYLGGLQSTSIPHFQSPIPGLAMVHW